MPLLIPRTFHRIWLGRKSIPAIFETWWQTWIDRHPGWEFITWTEDNLPPSRYPGLLERCCHLSQRSNILRWEILLDKGGVYVDTDYECIKNIEPLLEGAEAVVTQKKGGQLRFTPGVAEPREDPIWYLSAFAAAVPEHPLFRTMVDAIPQEDAAVSLSLGSAFLTRYVVLCGTPVKILPPEFLCPYHQGELHLNRFPRPAHDFPEAYALHHWSGKWNPEGFRPL